VRTDCLVLRGEQGQREAGNPAEPGGDERRADCAAQRRADWQRFDHADP